MQPFAYTRAHSVKEAVEIIHATDKAPGSKAEGDAQTQFIAGGTTLIDLMKLHVVNPARLVDIGSIEAQREWSSVTADKHGLHLGAMASMAAVAEDKDVLRDYPVIAQSLQLAASAQLRNMASLGGNVLQRTRCPYFRDVSFTACNKRNPGSGCDALHGVNRQHAVLGGSDACIATYPGDFAQSLIALDASVHVAGAKGTRTFPFAELHRQPAETPHVETTLRPGELITGFIVPAAPWTRRSAYLKIRDRASYAFALASAAVALDMADGRVRQARIALGGLATVPWRAKDAEASLAGKPLDERSAAEAAEIAFSQANPREYNAFKVKLGKETLTRALLHVATMEI
ncbi:MAG: xanthine dehydrogenase family protein subunit M [Beijerinckiaceae bacterium]|nr:xanthine dehydrogenase family protein subunit M [Beijerinckiaceae bacterium]